MKHKILPLAAFALGVGALSLSGSASAIADPTLSVAITGNTPYYNGANYTNVPEASIPTFTVEVTSTDPTSREVCAYIGGSEACGDVDDSAALTLTIPIVYEMTGCGASLTGGLTCDTWMEQINPYNGTARAMVRGNNASGDYQTDLATSADYPIVFKDGDFSAVKTTNLSISDVGVHSAGLTASINIPAALKSKISGAALSASIYRVFDREYINTFGGGMGGGFSLWDCHGGTSDSALDSDLAKAIYAIKKVETGDKTEPAYSYEGTDYFYYLSYAFQYFYRCSTTDGIFDALPADDKLELSLLGLIDNKKYGNWGGLYAENVPESVGLVSELDPLSRTYAGVILQLDDGSIWMEDVSGDDYGIASKNLIPEFTTAKLEALTEDELTDENKGSLIGESETSTSGSTFRIYVENLKQACVNAIAAGDTCFWSGYIYSTPTRLYAANGSDLLEIFKDDKGYYVEVALPAGYTGDHKIALYDEVGEFVGWIPVSILRTPSSGTVARTADGAKASTIISLVVAYIVLPFALLGTLTLRNNRKND